MSLGSSSTYRTAGSLMRIVRSSTGIVYQFDCDAQAPRRARPRSIWATIASLTSSPVGGAMRPFVSRPGIVLLGALLLLPLAAGVAVAAPEGTLTWGLHVTLAAKWLDPAETEAFINPFMVLYAIHDA